MLITGAGMRQLSNRPANIIYFVAEQACEVVVPCVPVNRLMKEMSESELVDLRVIGSLLSLVGCGDTRACYMLRSRHSKFVSQSKKDRQCEQKQAREDFSGLIESVQQVVSDGVRVQILRRNIKQSSPGDLPLRNVGLVVKITI